MELGAQVPTPRATLCLTACLPRTEVRLAAMHAGVSCISHNQHACKVRFRPPPVLCVSGAGTLREEGRQPSAPHRAWLKRMHARVSCCSFLPFLSFSFLPSFFFLLLRFSFRWILPLHALISSMCTHRHTSTNKKVERRKWGAAYMCYCTYVHKTEHDTLAAAVC